MSASAIVIHKSEYYLLIMMNLDHLYDDIARCSECEKYAKLIYNILKEKDQEPFPTDDEVVLEGPIGDKQKYMILLQNPGTPENPKRKLEWNIIKHLPKICRRYVHPYYWFDWHTEFWRELWLKFKERKLVKGDFNVINFFSEFHVSNVIKYRMGVLESKVGNYDSYINDFINGNMFEEPLSKEPYEHCLKHLKEEIEVAKPKMLLCMSKIGWDALEELDIISNVGGFKKSIGMFVKSKNEDIFIIPFYNPSYRIKNEIKKAFNNLDHGD